MLDNHFHKYPYPTTGTVGLAEWANSGGISRRMRVNLGHIQRLGSLLNCQHPIEVWTKTLSIDYVTEVVHQWDHKLALIFLYTQASLLPAAPKLTPRSAGDLPSDQDIVYVD